MMDARHNNSEECLKGIAPQFDEGNMKTHPKKTSAGKADSSVKDRWGCRV